MHFENNAFFRRRYRLAYQIRRVRSAIPRSLSLPTTTIWQTILQSHGLCRSQLLRLSQQRILAIIERKKEGERERMKTVSRFTVKILGLCRSCATTGISTRSFERIGGALSVFHSKAAQRAGHQAAAGPTQS